MESTFEAGSILSGATIVGPSDVLALLRSLQRNKLPLDGGRMKGVIAAAQDLGFAPTAVQTPQGRGGAKGAGALTIRVGRFHC
jgi:hypothetical protein